MPHAADPSARARTRGFTLIEVVVAVSILAVGLTVILRYFLYACASVDTVETEMAAGDFLRSQLDGLALGLGQNGTLGATQGAGSAVINNRRADWEWSSAPVGLPDEGADTGEKRLRSITARVTWKQDNRGRDLSVSRYVIMRGGE